MSRTFARWAALALVPPLALAACDDGSDPVDPDPAAPLLSVYLTDAPGDVEAVWVEIVEMTLHGESDPVVLLDESTGLIEITELVDRTREVVDDAVIPAGTYGRLGLRLGGAVLESTDGGVYVMGGARHPDGLAATGTLMCPSCQQSGLKILLYGVEVTEGENALVLDFDVTQSFGHQAGRSGRWVMRPVIHTDFAPHSDEEVETEATSIEGTVVLADGVEIPACPGQSRRGLRAFVPTATAATLTDDSAEPVVRTGRVDEDGEMEIRFVAPDTYTLGYVESVEYGTAAVLTFEATVEPGEVTVADEDVEDVVYTITSASCATGG